MVGQLSKPSAATFQVGDMHDQHKKAIVVYY